MMLPLATKIALALAYSAFEYWLGRTSRVKPNSSLELILNATKAVAGLLIKGKK